MPKIDDVIPNLNTSESEKSERRSPSIKSGYAPSEPWEIELGVRADDSDEGPYESKSPLVSAPWVDFGVSFGKVFRNYAIQSGPAAVDSTYLDVKASWAKFL